MTKSVLARASQLAPLGFGLALCFSNPCMAIELCSDEGKQKMVSAGVTRAQIAKICAIDVGQLGNQAPPPPVSSERAAELAAELNRDDSFQGQAKSKDQLLREAQERAQASVRGCAPGAAQVKMEDVGTFIAQQETLQGKVADSFERFSKKEFSKNAAIGRFNSFIQENNSIVAWGSGKVTDGVCAKAEISERIGKVYQATQTLLESYRQALN